MRKANRELRLLSLMRIIEIFFTIRADSDLTYAMPFNTILAIICFVQNYLLLFFNCYSIGFILILLNQTLITTFPTFFFFEKYRNFQFVLNIGFIAQIDCFIDCPFASWYSRLILDGFTRLSAAFQRPAYSCRQLSSATNYKTETIRQLTE